MSGNRSSRRAMGLQMGRVDHESIGFPALGNQGGENLVKHAKPTPSDEAVIDRLGRPIFGRRITPAQPILDYEDDAADDLPIINPRHPVRQRKIQLNTAHLRLR